MRFHICILGSVGRLDRGLICHNIETQLDKHCLGLCNVCAISFVIFFIVSLVFLIIFDGISGQKFVTTLRHNWTKTACAMSFDIFFIVISILFLIISIVSIIHHQHGSAIKINVSILAADGNWWGVSNQPYGRGGQGAHGVWTIGPALKWTHFSGTSLIWTH